MNKGTDFFWCFRWLSHRINRFFWLYTVIINSYKSRSCLLYIWRVILKFQPLCQTIPILKWISSISYRGVIRLLKPCRSHSLGCIVNIKNLIWLIVCLVLYPIILIIIRLSLWMVYLVGLTIIYLIGLMIVCLIGLEITFILVINIFVGISISIELVDYFFNEVYWLFCILLHDQIEFYLLDWLVYFLLYVNCCELFVFN